MVVYWATKLRGFFQHMSACMDGVEFKNDHEYYETSKFTEKIKSVLVRSLLFDLIGLFQVIKISEKECDCYGSFNRFLDSDKPYFLYLENPTALYHYTLGRISFPVGKKKFKKCLENPNLKYIVCMSDACKSTFERVNMPIPAELKIRRIYPLIPRNRYVNNELLKKKSTEKALECLFCAQGRRFITKGGLDVLEAFSNVRKSGCNVHLTIITKISELDKKTLEQIKKCEGVTLYDFSFTYEEMEKIYTQTSILIHPSSDDSFGLTVLEAMKGGCAIIASKMYAFPEMVEDRENGMLINPKYWMFTPEKIPNPIAWKHWKKRRLALKKNSAFVLEIEEAIRTLYLDRKLLLSFSEKSFERANTKFGEDIICQQWNDVWQSMVRNEK